MSSIETIDKEFDKRYDQYQKDFEKYLVNYVVPDIVACQIAQSHYRNCLSKISLKRHYSAMSDIINIFPKLEVVKKDIIKILNIKYNLTIINEDPLIIDKWK